MEYFARQCRCGKVVKYVQDERGILRLTDDSGYFKQRMSKIESKSIYNAKGQHRFSQRKVTYARRTATVYPGEGVIHMYCAGCRARLFFKKFQKMQL